MGRHHHQRRDQEHRGAGKYEAGDGEGEAEASKKFQEAAAIIAKDPIALRLRELQTWQEIGAEQNILMILIPSGPEQTATTIPTAMGTTMLKANENHKPREGQ